jgi:hypothetical protein
LVFALLAHNHLWLVAGALASSLTYSGAAAIHACLLVWRGPGLGETDLDALTAILIPACLITVPLLNWSSTLRKLGAQADRTIVRPDPPTTPTSQYLYTPKTYAERRAARSARHAEAQGNSSTRTIVIYWTFLVTVGMLATTMVTVICPTILGRNPSASATCQNLRVGNAPITVAVENVICAPGTDTTVDYIDTAYVYYNNCTNPCAEPGNKALFRRLRSLMLLDRTQARRSFGNSYDYFGSTRTGTEKRQSRFAGGVHIALLFGFPYVLLQGLWAACFGRREPAEVRDLLFLAFTSPKILKHIKPSWHRFWRGLIKWYAWIVYLLAVLIVLVCAPLFIMCIVANEFILWLDPSEEEPYFIGQWMPWAVVGLVLVAALIGSYHHSVVVIIRESWRFHTAKDNWNKSFAAHVPRPFDRHPSRRTRMTLPKRDTHQPTRTEVYTISATVFIALSKILHFFWDPVWNSVRSSTQRLHDEFAEAKDWFRDPARASEKTGRHPQHAKDDKPPHKHLAVVDDNDGDDVHRTENLARRTRESSTSSRGRDDDVESALEHLTAEFEPSNKSGRMAQGIQRRAASVDSGDRRKISRTW